MKKVLQQFLYFPLLFSCINGFAQGNTPQTISMVAGTSNSTAFSTQGSIGTDGGALSFYTHWDATYLYLGWSGGQTNYSSDMFYAAIDTDPNGTNGSTNAIEGVSFASAANTRKPDYYVVYENNSGFYGAPVNNGNAYEIYNVNAGNWNFVSRSNGNDNVTSRVNFSNSPNGEVRLRISWSSLGFTPGSTTPIAITMWTNNGSGNFMWSRFPTDNVSTGSTPKTLAYSFLFYNTSSGVNPSTAKVIESNTFTTSSFSGTQNLGLTVSGNVSISGNATLNSNLNILSGSTLNINNNSLTIQTVTGSGTLTGSSTSNLTLGGAAGTLNFTQTNASTRSINNITFNSGATATLGDVLDVYGDIEFTPSTGNDFNVNGNNLTLKSTNTYTARIGNLTGSTLGGATNITMERWIKLRAGGAGRAYRLLAPTVNTTGSMRLNWMENGMNTAIGTNDNPVPNYGTQITGALGNTNGFDKTQSNATSIYTASNAVDTATLVYTAVGNTSGTLNAKTGYFMYLRGDRAQDMTLPLAAAMPTSSTTLRTTGTLLQGTQTSFTNAFIGGAGAVNLVTNPYASPINWSLVQPACTGVTTSYTYWDANIGSRGGFATVTTGGVSTPATSATQFIQSGQAFFVEASGASAPTVSIQEGHKAAGNNNDVFLVPPPPVESFRTELYFTEPNGFRRVADGAIAVYNNSYSAAVDASDAREINNWDENIAIARDGKHLAIESRPVITKGDDLPIFMNNMKKQGYEFEFTPLVFTNASLKAELVDNYLNTRTLLSVTSPTVVSFTVTADPASSARDRFKVVFGAFGNPQGMDAITIKASRQGGAVQVDWVSKTETDMATYEVERSAFGTAFTKMHATTAMGNSSTAVNYNWLDANPNAGTNFYRIKAVDKAGNIKYSDMVQVMVGKAEPGITVYPNPIPDNSFKVDLNNLARGTYLLNLYSNTGMLIHTQQFVHDGSQATRIINLKADIAKGAYQLQLSNGTGFKTSQILFKN